MPRLYLKLLFPIVVSGLMMMIVARTLGSTQEANPSLRGFTESCEGKSQPCWNGIVPGKTTAESTFRYLAQLGYAIDDAIFSNTRQLTAHFPDRPDCGQITANIDQRIGILYEFYVHPCDMPLGAFLDSFGTPVIANLEYEDCSVLLLFMEGHIQVTAANSVQPTHAIIGFGLLSDETVQLNQSRDSERFQWAGILPMWRYKSQFAPPFECP